MEFKQCPRCCCMKNIRKNKTMCKRCEDNFSISSSNADTVRKAIEKKFLGIRGWKNWEEYDKIRESSEGDKNCRFELIDIAINETTLNIKNTEEQNVGK